MKKIELNVIRLLIVFLVVTAGAYGQAKQPAALVAAQEGSQAAPQAGSAQTNADRPQLQHRYPRYQVMRDDVLLLSFRLSPELNQEVTIQPDGYITLPNVGSLYIQGMTVPEVVEALKKAYAKVLHDPIIDVDLTEFQKPFFLVSGQVGKPGQYDLRHITTVSEAIAIAGGFAPTAKTQVMFYHRISNDTMEVKKLSVKDILHGKNVNEDVQLSSGDMIFVPEKMITTFRKYVPYGLTAAAYNNY